MNAINSMNSANSIHPKPTDKALEKQVHFLEAEVEKFEKAKQSFQRQGEYISALHQTALALIDRLDRKELLQTVLERVSTLVGTAHGFVFLINADKKEMEMRVGKGFFAGHLGLRVKRGEGVGGTVWVSEKSVLVDDYGSWSRRIPEKTFDGLQSIIGIPLISDQGVQGVIGVAHVASDKRFEADDVAMLERFAALALIALEKARLYANVRVELAERMRAEEQIRRSEQRYRGFLEASPDPVVVYDMKGNATYVNSAFEQVFGFSKEAVIGKKIDFVPEKSWPATQKAIDKMLSGQKVNLFETHRRTRDNRILDVQLSSTLYLDHEGNTAGNIVTLRDITQQKQAEKELKNYRDHLEDLVQERTLELEITNLHLGNEIEERKKVEMALRKREKELKAQSDRLENVNIALKVLLKQREADKHELEEKVTSNIKELVNPYLERLKTGQLSTRQNTLVDVLETNLNNIVSPFTRNLSAQFTHFTPMEVRVANLVKEGKTNKEMAELLLIAKNTVMFHRYNIRRKLGIKNKKVNLCTFLMALEK
jgi:PAS domain S-box-containing protein